MRRTKLLSVLVSVKQVEGKVLPILREMEALAGEMEDVLDGLDGEDILKEEAQGALLEMVEAMDGVIMAWDYLKRLAKGLEAVEAERAKARQAQVAQAKKNLGIKEG